ncbi:lamin tail domain-containing protein [Actinoplanes sp. NPDC051411]|uniref:lamin tail domain-containing protein n=1 Tax=Actinoplanes sp. NPDC051411 TaxID=3155522 RepID=UPI003430C750
MIKKLVAAAAAAGATAALALGSPSFAATAPTLAGPDARIGYGPVELSGTAAPGASVQLYETAIVFDDLEPADDWANGGGPVTATADSGGHWRLQRILDSGFYFQVESEGVRSNKLTVRIQQNPVLTLTSTSANTVSAHVEASPGEPTLAAQVQVNLSGGWTTIAAGEIGADGTFDGTARNVPAGSHAFRAYVGADPSNGVLAGYSAARNLTVAGTSAPAKPTGSVQFTKIQYRAKSLNAEWVLVTNNTGATVDLRSWTIRDATNHVYTFTSTYRLSSKGAVYVHTGKGTNSSAHRYWGRTGYIWNDGGDTAILRDAKGKTVDTCKWGAGSGVTVC